MVALVRRLPCSWSKWSLVNAWVFRERGKPGHWSKIKPPRTKTRTPLMRQPKNWTKKHITVEPLTHVFFVLHFDAAYFFFLFYFIANIFDVLMSLRFHQPVYFQSDIGANLEYHLSTTWKWYFQPLNGTLYFRFFIYLVCAYRRSGASIFPKMCSKMCQKNKPILEKAGHRPYTVWQLLT